MSQLSVESLRHELTGHGAWTREHGLLCFEAKGKDALDLLHRLSTNDLLSGGIPRCKPTVLTTEKGRVVDFVEVVVTGDRTLLIVHAGAAEEVRKWVERFTILEEVELTPITYDATIVWFIGPQFESSTARHLESWRSPLGLIPAYRGIVPAEFLGSLLASLDEAGCMELDRDAFDLLRIMSCTPSYPNELNTSVNPLEVGLRDAISFTKGCYVGQEVVARLDAYEKVQRELLVLRITGIPDPGMNPYHVLAGDRAAGTVTSMSVPLSDGTTLALALCRKDAIDSKATLSVRAENENSAFAAHRFEWSELRAGGTS